MHNTSAIKISEARELSSTVSRERCRQGFNWGAEVWLPSGHKHFCSRSQSSVWPPERAGVQMYLTHSVWGYFRLPFWDRCLLYTVPLVRNLRSPCFRFQFLSWVPTILTWSTAACNSQALKLPGKIQAHKNNYYHHHYQWIFVTSFLEILLPKHPFRCTSCFFSCIC